MPNVIKSGQKLKISHFFFSVNKLYTTQTSMLKVPLNKQE